MKIKRRKRKARSATPQTLTVKSVRELLEGNELPPWDLADYEKLIGEMNRLAAEWTGTDIDWRVFGRTSKKLIRMPATRDPRGEYRRTGSTE